MHNYVSDSVAKTHEIAAAFASSCKIGDVIYLRGDLGAGKSEFARGFIRYFCGKDQVVPSPTFTILQTYDGKDKTPIYHFDLYRLNSSEEAEELGLFEALNSGVTLIEWPERLEGLKINNHVFEVCLSLDKDLRSISISN